MSKKDKMNEKQKEKIKSIIDRDITWVKNDILIFYCSPFEFIQGFISDEKKAEDVFASIDKCTCGAEPVALQTEYMGDYDFGIYCSECRRYIERSMYDFDVTEDMDDISLAVRDWNVGISQEDVENIQRTESERLRLYPDDMVWRDIYPNNMISNGKCGIYSIVNARKDNLFAVKWSIVFQQKEVSPMVVNPDEADLYLLYCKRYLDISEKLEYPKPLKEGERFSLFMDTAVNDYGEFVRAYRTLKEAKEGALARLGCQGINADTII